MDKTEKLDKLMPLLFQLKESLLVDVVKDMKDERLDLIKNSKTN